jgi:hypothetical protein
MAEFSYKKESQPNALGCLRVGLVFLPYAVRSRVAGLRVIRFSVDVLDTLRRLSSALIPDRTLQSQVGLATLKLAYGPRELLTTFFAHHRPPQGAIKRLQLPGEKQV